MDKSITPAHEPDTPIRVANDTQKRMLAGVFLYPFLWLIIGFGSGLYQQNAPLFWSATVILFLATGLRFAHLKSLSRYQPPELAKWSRWLHWFMLPHSLTWGLLFAYSLQQHNDLFLLYMTFSTAGMVPGASNNFAPNLRVGTYFILSMLVPAFVVTTVVTQQWVMTLLLAVYMLFIFDLTRRQSKEYWQSLTNELVLAKQSRTDVLTQLDNRRYFDEKLVQLCHLTSRSHEKIAVAIIDCDHFKAINDRYGHDVGDLCLRHLAHLLARSLPRATDVCARYGGEEFSLILPGTDLAGVKIVAERIRKCVESEPLQLSDKTISMTVSIGCVARVVEQFEGDLPTQLFKQADKALYMAKASGRNCCIYFTYDESSSTYMLASN